MADWQIDGHAAAFHREALVWDNHGCLPHEDCDAFLPELLRYRDAGVDVAVINIGDSDVPMSELIAMAERIRGFVEDHGESLMMLGTVAHIPEAKRLGKTAVALNVEGTYAIDDDLDRVSQLHECGVRWMSMVYNRRNASGYGCHDEEDRGLTSFGYRLVDELDRVGIIKCCSHTGYRTARDVIENSDKPCIFSHSNPLALWDHPRNIPDELIRSCASGGGVIGINGVGIFLGENDASIAAIIRHIDYVSSLVGPEHVGIGLDFVFDMEGMNRVLAANSGMWPRGYGYRPGIRFFAPDDLPRLTEALLSAGYGEAMVRGVLGANWLRVAREVWQ